MEATKTREWVEEAFHAWYGGVIIDRGHRAGQDITDVSIDDDHELLLRAFRAGWEWGETLERERHQVDAS